MSIKSFSQRAFGVEFEVGNESPQYKIAEVIGLNSPKALSLHATWSESKDNDFWDIKYDSTCGVNSDPGWEVASFKASGWPDLHHIAEVAAKLKQAGFLVNSNCGFHIHAEVADFSPRQMGVLLGRWLKIEPWLCEMVPIHRVYNYFCRLLFKQRKIALTKKHTGQFIWEKLKPTNFSPHENIQKKVTLNTVNYAAALAQEARGLTPSRKTIEFRMPEGTLNYEDVTCWVRFFVHFIETAKTAAPPNDLKSAKNLRHFFRLAGLYESKRSEMSDGLLTTKLWLLKRFYNYGNPIVKSQIVQGQF